MADKQTSVFGIYPSTQQAESAASSLVQAGFKASQKQEFGGARYGWKMMGEKLVDLLARIP